MLKGISENREQNFKQQGIFYISFRAIFRKVNLLL